MDVDHREQATATQVVHLSPTQVLEGQMNDRVRSFEWSRTPLGPLAQWPAYLRIAVDMMLFSRFPSCLVWGPEMSVIHNDAYLKIIGQQSASLGCRFDQLWSDAWETLGPKVFKALQGEASFIEDAPLTINRNGVREQVYLTFSCTPVRDDDGVVTGFLYTVVETTASIETLRQWRELALNFERQIDLFMSEREHLRELSREVMVVVGHDLRLRAANHILCQALGWKEQQITGRLVMELIHPADRAEVQLEILRILRGGKIEQVETRLRHHDGHYRWFRWDATADDEVLTAVGRDITQEREETIRQAETLLHRTQRIGAVGQMVYGMVHEYNNLLAGIMGSLELLDRRIAQGRTDQLDSYVQVAQDSARRAVALNQRLLAFSSCQPLAPRPLELNHVLMDLEPLVRHTLGAHVRLQWQLDVAPWLVNLDASQLEHTVLNLCANARDACGLDALVTIRCANERLTVTPDNEEGLPAGDYVAVVVEDNGHGMSAEDLARAFEPFFSTKPKGQASGLGLPMVYGFVRQSGGRAWIDSTIDQGTRVTMLFPRYEGEQPNLPVAMPMMARSAQVQGGRVLLIDSEANLRALMKEILLDHGYDVHDAADANSALRLYRTRGHFDLVITDICLPGGFSGRQVANAVRLLQAHQKVLFISGHTETPIEQRMLDEPGTALLSKPFSLETLVWQVQAMLEP
ncbi:hybrid sensor histidine kinase/response regulator [Pseudomonas sp. X10]